jgi:hypothetical protein
MRCPTCLRPTLSTANLIRLTPAACRDLPQIERDSSLQRPRVLRAQRIASKCLKRLQPQPDCDDLCSILVQIFARNIVLRYLVRANFLLVSVVSTFDTSDDVGFECIPFLDQLADALRIRSFDAGQAL